MKKIILTLLVPILGSFTGYSQAELTTTAPPATTSTGLRAPNGTTAHTTVRGVIIVTAAELAAFPTGSTITKLSLELVTGVSPGPAGGNIQFYLENTTDVTNLKSTAWATTIAPMTSVYNGAFSVPAVAGPTANLTLTSSFVYNGGSVYVAYDYLGSVFTTLSATYSANSTIAGGWKGQVATTTTPPDTLTQSSSFRPCVNFTINNPFTNELNVSGLVGEKGIFNNTIKTKQTITSTITNTSSVALTNIPVTLNITGANPYTTVQTIPSIGAGATTTVLFNNVSTVNLGTQTINVSIPADELPSNNLRTFIQKIQCDTIGYANSSVQTGSVGFNTGAGVIGVRHAIPNNIETYVKSISNYFPTTASVAGNTIKGILTNSSGVFIDSTNLITITPAMLGTKQDFNFLNGAIDVSGTTVYVAFRQTANGTTGYFPFANQTNSYVDPNAAVTFPTLTGGIPTPVGSGLGYLMIESTLTFGGFNVNNSSTGGTLCSNTALTITPTAGYSNYNFFVNGASVQNGATASYTTAPLTANTTFNVDITNGACMTSSNVQTISIVTALINNLSEAICQGDSYTVGTNVYSAAGSYVDTLLSVAGCDSVVNLTLTLLAPTSSNISASICPGGTYAFGPQALTTAGIYTDVVPNAAGCDSTITLTLTMNSATASTVNTTVCAADYQFGIQNLTTSGTYTRTIQNSVGCDSVITLNLTLNTPVSVTAAASGSTLTATATPATVTYQWIDCATSMAIPGATSMTFIPVSTGDYAVVAMTPDNCSDTSICINIDFTGIDELTSGSTIKVYPNPASTTVHAVWNGGDILSYSVLDANGRIVLSNTMESGNSDVEFSVEKFEKGTYILQMQTAIGTVAKTFIKN